MTQTFISLFESIFKYTKGKIVESKSNISWNDFTILINLQKKLNKINLLKLTELNIEFDKITTRFTHSLKNEFDKCYIDAIKKYIENTDDDILKKIKSKEINPNWTSYKKVKRHIYLKGFGKIHFKVRKYLTKDSNNNKSYIIPTLLILNIDSKGIMVGHKQEMLLSYVQMKNIRKLAKTYGMKKDFAHRLIKELILEEPNYEKITDHSGPLFVNIDGLWIRNNFKSKKEIVETFGYFQNKREIISVSMFTGSIQSTKNSYRKVIQNKLSFWFNETKTIQQNVSELKRIIKICYPNISNIIVIGDGAPVIKSITNYLNASYVMDNFHYMKTLIACWGKAIGGLRKAQKLIKDFKGEFYKGVYENKSFEEIIEEITRMYNPETGEVIKLKDIKKIFNYNFKHFDEFKEGLKSKYISIIESEQSRLVSSYLRYSRASFGVNVPNKIRVISSMIYNKISNFISLDDFVNSSWIYQNKIIDEKKELCNIITSEVGYLPNSKEKSSNGCWVTKKVKSDY